MKILNLLKFSIAMVALASPGTNAQAACDVKESAAAAGGYRELQVGKQKLVDVDSFKEIDGKVFYATSPVYGKPEIGVIDCGIDKRTKLVAPKNIDKSYPDGTDFFRLKDIIKNKKTGAYTLRYYYAPDVDGQDFKNLEIKKNLKSIEIPSGK